MKKKKSKRIKKKKYLNYKLFAFIGGIFHLIVYMLYDSTFFDSRLFWGSLFFCGLALGTYFIMKMNLLSPESYKKIEGTKMKIFMFFACVLMIIGATITFGNVINGMVLGLNYIGKTNDTDKYEYKIQKIIQNRTGGKKRMRRNNPKVYFEKDDKLIRLNLPERYTATTKYSEFKTIELNLSMGLLGFEIVDSYELKR